MTAAEEHGLEDALLSAHEREDKAEVAELYRKAGKLSEDAGRTEEAFFRYTQAYVYALESGSEALAHELKEKLKAKGREE
ncbi:MAG: hypothetical protein AAGI06_14895 [Pseudomonadota bacterium]